MKMKKTHCRRIIGVLVFALIFSFCCIYHVRAEDKTNAYSHISGANNSSTCKKAYNKDDSFWEKRYDVDLDYNVDTKRYVLSMKVSKVDELKKIKKKIKFKIVELATYLPEQESPNQVISDQNVINSKIVSSNKYLTPGGSGSVEIAKIDGNASSLEVTIVPEGFSDPTLVSKCGANATFEISVEVEGGADPEMSGEGYFEGDYEPVSVKGVDCTNYKSKFNEKSFEYNFCNDKANAIAAGVKVKKSSEISGTTTFKCDYKTIKLNNDSKECNNSTDTNSDSYYTANNTKFLWGEEVKSYSSKYVYHYGCNTKKTDVSCRVKCEEIVTVQYGPPVASIAGMCFEYKVKVTSRVNCNVESPPKKPDVDKRYCTPAPICKHVSRTASGGTHVTTYRQGGPNSEFDSCVESCDGGVYSDKCSNKCYKEVYGKSGVVESSGNEIAYADKLSNNDSYNVEQLSSGGRYVCSNGTIVWNEKSRSRWHKTHSWGIPPMKDYKCYSAGTNIPKRCDCDDACYWVGCKGDVYLNPGDYNRSIGKSWDGDETENNRTYQNLKEKCEAAAKCSTKTATFVISVNYSHNTKDGEQKTKICYPYSKDSSVVSIDTECSNPDKLTSREKTDVTDTSNNKNTTIMKADNRGCYTDKNQRKWYQAEWSFPGSWINIKTGEISYIDKSSKVGWQDHNDKFCIPLNAKDVNQVWWNYYYKIKTNNDPCLKGDNSITGSGSAYNDVCGPNENTYNADKTVTTIDSTKISDSDITWNIKAGTKKFGYFGWNINIACFYALNSNPSNKKVSGSGNNDSSGNVDKCITTSTSEPEFRTVNLTNLFPSSDGSEKINTNGTGRKAVPFNWADRSSTGGYKNQLSGIGKNIQNLGESIYNDNFLDYEFELSPTILAELRGHTSDAVSDSSYNSSVSKDENKLVIYESNLIRKTLKNATKKKPGTNQLKKNRLCGYKCSK